MKKIILFALIAVALVGCSSEADRLAVMEKKFGTKEIYWEKEWGHYIIRTPDGAVHICERNAESEATNQASRQIFGPLKPVVPQF